MHTNLTASYSTFRLACWLLALMAFMFPALALPSTLAPRTGSIEQDWARDAVRSGSLRPLTDILKLLEREFLGQVVEIELDREGGRLVYEIELMTLKGHIVQLTYEATSGALLSVRGRGVENARRQSPAAKGLLP